MVAASSSSSRWQLNSRGPPQWPAIRGLGAAAGGAAATAFCCTSTLGRSFAAAPQSIRLQRGAAHNGNVVPKSFAASSSLASKFRGCAFITAPAVFAAAAVLATGSHWKARRGVTARNATKLKGSKRKQEEADNLEATLMALFEQSDEPDIYKIRECLGRMTKLNPKPNASLQGDWIIYWSSREMAVDELFGTGETVDNLWVNLKEYLFKIYPKKEGRMIEAAEVIRRVGPFPNEFNKLKGVYSAKGTHGFSIKFDDIKTDKDEVIQLKSGKDKIKVKTDVLYSSPTMIVMQNEGEGGEFDFFVLTPVENFEDEVDKLIGIQRRRFLFN